MIHSKGFSLVELMATLLILAIVLSLGVPGFRSVMQMNRRSAESNVLVAALNLARSEAAKRGITVSVCRSSNGSTCGGAGWNDGWIVFVNNDNDSPAAVDAGEEILRITQITGAEYTWTPDANFANFVSYEATGMSSSAGEFVYCDDTGAAGARAIFVNAAGRIRLSTDSDDDGTHDDGLGPTNLTCP